MINRNAKGYRKESEVRAKYLKEGYICYKPIRSRFNDNDVFNLFDLLLWHPKKHDLVMLSVKSRYGSKSHKKDLENFIVESVKVGIVEYRGKRKGNERETFYANTKIS